MFCEKCGNQIFSDGNTCETCGAAHNKRPASMLPVDGDSFQNSYIGQRREGWVILLLSIVTCGIYSFYWLYVTMEDINKAAGEQRMDSTLLLIGSIFCSPIILVALYKIDKNLQSLSREHDTHYGDNFILWLLLTIFCGIGMLVSYFQVSKGLNDIWDRRQGVNPMLP